MVGSLNVNLKYQEDVIQREKLPIFIKDHKNPKIMIIANLQNTLISKNQEIPRI